MGAVEPSSTPWIFGRLVIMRDWASPTLPLSGRQEAIAIDANSPAVGQSLDLRHQTLQLGICESFVHGDWGERGCDY